MLTTIVEVCSTICEISSIVVFNVPKVVTMDEYTMKEIQHGRRIDGRVSQKLSKNPWQVAMHSSKTDCIITAVQLCSLGQELVVVENKMENKTTCYCKYM